MNETSPQLSGSAQSGRQERKCKQIITIEFDKAWAGYHGRGKPAWRSGEKIKKGFMGEVTFE